MWHNRLVEIIALVLVLQAVISVNGAPAAQKGEKGQNQNDKKELERIIRRKLKTSTPVQIKKFKMDAARRMQADLAKTFIVLSNNKDLPPDVQEKAYMAAQAVRGNQMAEALAASLPNILIKAPPGSGRPGDQLQNIVGSAISNAPHDLKNPLQGALNFIGANLDGLNNVLMKTAGAAPDLMAGSVKTLAGALGTVQETLNGSVANLGHILGSLLSSIPS